MRRSIQQVMALNNGRAVYNDSRMLVFDHPDECWFHSADFRLHVWSHGALLEEERVPSPAAARERAFLVQKLDGLYVDIALFESTAIITRGSFGGRCTQAALKPTDVEALAAHYRKLGFQHVYGWNVSRERLLKRELRLTQPGLLRAEQVQVDGAVRLTVSTRVVGTEKTVAEERTSFASREEAVAAAEQRLFALEQEGLSPFTLSMPQSTQVNPEPPGLPPVALTAFARPETPHAAVDVAVARLAELHHKLRAGHFIVELLQPDADRDRLDSMGHGSRFFRDLHAERFGRWLRPAEAPTEGSSFEYFVRRYGTATWVVKWAGKVPTHYSGNVSGGGQCVLEVNADEYNVEELANHLEQPLPGMAEAHVFHGGWHDGLSFIFDRRTRTPEGEFGIHEFDENDPGASWPEQPLAPDEIQPFGFWLFDRVEAICQTLVPELLEAQPPPSHAGA
ncbi:hypothetical protein KYC5002_12535 [Archangium violaceum]|uniref:hypothetical protein n=2 Tax=Archangium TaxID=47 RepID=UPI002B2F820E|nr:hypothetical protein KYC5002_12535 [Archangium gephyra]